MTWQPQAEGLRTVLDMLRDSSSPDSTVQKAVAKKLHELRFIPDFLAYLSHVLVHGSQEAVSHRAVAGLLLKNALIQRTGPALTDGDAMAMNYVKSTVLLGLAEPEIMVRQTAGTVVMAILANEETGAWPEALDTLSKGMASQDENVVEGVFNTFQKISEDCPQRLDMTVGGANLLDHLVPEFIKFTGHSSFKVRLYALETLQSLSALQTPAVTANVDAYLQALFARATDNSADIRRSVCAALGLILSHRPDKLVPEMKNVVDYIAYCTKDPDETVALEACEFWLTFAEDPALKDQLLPYIGQIAPLLLHGMVYSEVDLLYLDNDDDDEAVPDKESDIKPRNYGGKTHGAHETNDPSSSSGGAGKSREAADRALDDDDEDDDDDFDDDDDEGAAEWNIRKCSAAALDVMAVSFGSTLLDILLPYLKERLFNDDWRQKESGILALGAIAEGCIDGLEPHLPQLVPWLISALKDKKALVRSITCWTLSRYSSWVVAVSATDKTQFFIPAMEGLLQMVLDVNKRVQEAGCSAFATLEEEAGGELVPFLEPILRNLTYAFTKYQQKNLLILYDALGTLADSVMGALGTPQYLEILMPPLINKWMSLGDSDPDLVPLLECLSSVTLASGKAFQPYAQPVYQRCLTIIATSLQQWDAFTADPDNVEEPDRTFIVVALDLLSGLAQGLADQMPALIEQAQPPLLQLIALCLNHFEPPVRQSAHALLGDMAMTCFPLLRPYVPELMPAIIEQITPEPQPDCISVCNNAAWAAGEIAIQYRADATPIEPFVDDLIRRLIPILLNPKSPKSLSENAAVTIGRLGLVATARVAPHLGTFAQAWCTALWEIKDNDEKDSAFRGFCMLIGANPAGLESSFIWFCNAVCKWQHPSRELDGMFRSILQAFKAQLGAGWDAQVAAFPPVIRERLRERYDV
ncbi:Transportin-1 [Vanrija pseudolonga]|uniref:Transportin-1 n=1 Tax=Vanrija pseudolonga TaxID=143232 RepID=A0AAF0Y0L8_9TREE|nr:Transportin-1 [Vanrija pseudolonga]